jgi:hypothetical protein
MQVVDPSQIWQALADCICGATSTPEGNTSAKIADILIGSKKIRLGTSPCAEHRAYLESQISRFIAAEKPIEVMCLWGAVKGYALDDMRLEADLGDLLGIRRFAALDAQVKQHYAPGLRVRLIRENVGEYALTTRPMVVKRCIEAYRRTLDQMANLLSPSGNVAFEDESNLLAALGVTDSDFLSMGTANGKAILEYYTASDHLPDERKAEVPEFATLTGLGWRGIIPAPIRAWYTGRCSAEHAGEDPAWPISQYFGFALTRYKVGLYNGSVADNNGTIAPLKASFVPYPDGTDNALRRGRLEYKVKDSKGNNSVPPWCGHTFLQPEKGHEPTILGVRDVAAAGFKCEPFDLTMLFNGEQLRVRADLLAA